MSKALMAVEFEMVRIAVHTGSGVYFVDDIARPQLVAEAKSIDALQKKLAKLLDVDAGKIRAAAARPASSPTALSRKEAPANAEDAQPGRD
jgi:hypothetical protein